MTNVQAWWQQRDPREQRILLIGLILAAAMLLWALVWKPLVDSRASLAQGNQRLAADLTLMRASAGTLQVNGHGEDAARARAGRSLLALADAGVREAGLAGSLRRIEPAGDGRVRLLLESVPFDPITDWLQRLAREQGVRVAELSATRTEYVGQVDLQLLIEDP